MGTPSPPIIGKPMTSAPSILAVILHELRAESATSVERLADALNIEATAWVKIESGGAIDLASVIRGCYLLGVQPSTAMLAAEHYARVLQSSGWDVLFGRVPRGRDALLAHAADFWSTPAGSGWMRDARVLGPLEGFQNAPVFRFAMDRQFELLMESLDFTPPSRAES